MQSIHYCQVKCKVSKISGRQIPKLPNTQTENFTKCMADNRQVSPAILSHSNLTLDLALNPFFNLVKVANTDFRAVQHIHVVLAPGLGLAQDQGLDCLCFLCTE